MCLHYVTLTICKKKKKNLFLKKLNLCRVVTCIQHADQESGVHFWTHTYFKSYVMALLAGVNNLFFNLSLQMINGKQLLSNIFL